MADSLAKLKIEVQAAGTYGEGPEKKVETKLEATLSRGNDGVNGMMQTVRRSRGLLA